MKSYNLWARIGNTDYRIANGSTFSDELGETLDSGRIILPHVFGAIDVKPYDDVYIHDYGEGLLPNRPYGQIFVPQNGHFYRHMLVYIVSREQVSLDVENPDSSDYFYNYTIQLISETKGLENVLLPNRTITQKMNTVPSSMLEGRISVDTMGYKFASLGMQSTTRPGIELKGYQLRVINQSVNPYCWLTYGTEWETNGIVALDKYYGYNNFSGPKKVLEAGKTYRYPDWNISNVTLLTAYSGQNMTVEKEMFTPVKKWVVVRRRGPLPERSAVLSYFSSGNYNVGDTISNGNTVVGIHIGTGNDEFTVTNEVTGTDPVFENGVYDIYLYVPYTESQTITEVTGIDMSVFSMVPDSSNDETGAAPVFVRWPGFVVSGGNIGSGDDSIKSIYEVAREAVELYSPYIKMTTGEKVNGVDTWEYRRKYVLQGDPLGGNSDSFLRENLGAVVCPEMSMNLPTLREYLTKIFNVRDMIPVVHDGVITAMSLSERGDNFDSHVPTYERTYEQWSMEGSQFTDRVMRVYSGALSNDKTTKCVDRVGFRNRNVPMMTLSNMVLELTHPVYSIEKIYMCYYKKYEVGGIQKSFLCKQDITPFVMLSSVRNLLSEDWRLLGQDPETVEELSRYKFSTIGYSIGSTEIDGWGQVFSYPVYNVLNVTYRKYSVIELILRFMDNKYPFGIDSSGIQSISEGVILTDNNSVDAEIDDKYKSSTMPTHTVEDHFEAFFDKINKTIADNDTTPNWLVKNEDVSNFTLMAKTMMFEIEYKGFISGPVVASKDVHDGNVVSRDNQSSSLSFVEGDGINEKEKVNRLGNASVVVSQRTEDFNSMAPISSVRNSGIHDDEILYRRSFVINENHINVTYYLCKDYVLRNYFTSVYSKHRPFSLASFSESVKREESRVMELVLSKDQSYYQESSRTVDMGPDAIEALMSFWKKTTYRENGNAMNENMAGLSYIYIPETDVFENQYYGYFATDTQVFTSGNSLCFNVSMTDNVSNGVYITSWAPNFSDYMYNTLFKVDSVNTANGVTNLTADQRKALDDVTGSLQDWYMYPVNVDNGSLSRASFGVGTNYGMKERYEQLSTYSDSKVDNDIVSARSLPQLDILLTYNDPDNQSTAVTYQSKPMRYVNADWKSGKVTNQAFQSTEFARSLFFASVDDGGNETSDVVFKDGKEVMSTMLQIEPVSSNDDVMFSKYMMELSEVYGEKSKNFTGSQEFSRNGVAYFEKSYYLNSQTAYNPNGIYVYHQEMSGYPIFSLCIPDKIVNEMITSGIADVDISNLPPLVWGNPDYDFDNLEYSESNTIYRITMTPSRITGEVSDGSISMRAHILIETRHERTHTIVKDEDIVLILYRISGSDDTMYSATGATLTNKIMTFIGNTDGIHRYGTALDYISVNWVYNGNNPEEGRRYFEINFMILAGQEGQDFHIVYPYNFIDNGISNSEIQETSTQIVNMFVVPGYASVVETRNMYWVYGNTMDKNTPFTSYGTVEFWQNFDASSVTAEDILFGYDSDGKPRIHINTSPVTGSIRLYYKENDMFNFVFGVNIDKQTSVDVYVSLLDVRSRTVYDSETGDPAYRIVNYVSDTDYSYVDHVNYCIPKEA